MHLKISLFGGFQASQADRSLAFVTDRARALLAYLAVEAHQPHSRDKLAALLWPDDRELLARQNLSQTLTRVRQAIGDYDADPRYLQVSRPALQLNRNAPITVDLLDFQALLAVCTNHKPEGRTHCHLCIGRLSEAVELYRGPFLEGAQFVESEIFEEWVLLMREQSQRQALDALHTLTVYYAAKGDQRLAQHYAARQLVLEPWCEIAHRQLMRALAHTGHRGAALAQYESCRRLLADELAVEPEAQTVTLAEEIRHGQIQVKAPVMGLPVKIQ